MHWRNDKIGQPSVDGLQEAADPQAGRTTKIGTSGVADGQEETSRCHGKGKSPKWAKIVEMVDDDS